MAQELVKPITNFFDTKGHSHSELLWAVLLSQMGEFEKLVKYFQKLIDAGSVNTPLKIIHLEMVKSLIRLRRLDEALEYYKLVPTKHQTCNGLYDFYRLVIDAYTLDRQYSRATDGYKKVLQLGIEHLGEHRSDTAKNYQHLGELYRCIGQYQLALDNLDKAKDICEKHHPTDLRLFRKIFSCFGDIYRQIGERPRAVEYYQKAADIYKKISSENNNFFCSDSSVFSNWALALLELREVNYSLQCLHKSLVNVQKDSVNNPLFTVEELSFIGKVYVMKGEFEISLKFIKNALIKPRQSYGIIRVGAANLYYNIGIALECLGRNDDALKAFETAVNIKEKILPEGDRKLAYSLSSIGNQYRIKKDFSLAKKYCDEALAMQERILPADDVDNYLPFYHMGMLLYDQQEYKKSLSYLWKARQVMWKYPDVAFHIHHALILVTTGDINKRLGNVCPALRCSEQVLSYYKKFFSHEHPIIIGVQSKIKTLQEESQAS